MADSLCRIRLQAMVAAAAAGRAQLFLPPPYDRQRLLLRLHELFIARSFEHLQRWASDGAPFYRTWLPLSTISGVSAELFIVGLQRFFVYSAMVTAFVKLLPRETGLPNNTSFALFC